MGKLLKRVGEHRVLWGTDAVWYGSPQAQLQAFRAFTISDEFQALFGYPALTDAVKNQVLGLNAAKLFHLDAEATRCALASDPLTTAQPMNPNTRDRICDRRVNSASSSSPTPTSFAIARIGTWVARSSRSPSPATAMGRNNPSAIARVAGRSDSIELGTKAFCTSDRKRLCVTPSFVNMRLALVPAS